MSLGAEQILCADRSRDDAFSDVFVFCPRCDRNGMFRLLQALIFSVKSYFYLTSFSILLIVFLSARKNYGELSQNRQQKTGDIVNTSAVTDNVIQV